MAKVDFEAIKPANAVAMVGTETKEKKEPKKKEAHAVVSKDAVVSSKAGPLQKMASKVIKKDLKDIVSYLFWEELVPGIKQGALNGLSMMFFGEALDYDARSGSKKRKSSRGSVRTNYRSAYESSRRDRDDDDEDEKLDYRHIVLRNRDDAQDVVDEMKDLIRENGAATIADLFEMIGETSEFTDNNWGWERTGDIGLRRINKGYLIDVAKAKYLDD